MFRTADLAKDESEILYIKECFYTFHSQLPFMFFREDQLECVPLQGAQMFIVDKTGSCFC